MVPTGRRLTDEENLGSLLRQALEEAASEDLGHVWPSDERLQMPAMVDGYFNLPKAAARFLELVGERTSGRTPPNRA